jgi:hypothetical protein
MVIEYCVKYYKIQVLRKKASAMPHVFFGRFAGARAYYGSFYVKRDGLI